MRVASTVCVCSLSSRLPLWCVHMWELQRVLQAHSTEQKDIHVSQTEWLWNQCLQQKEVPGLSLCQVHISRHEIRRSVQGTSLLYACLLAVFCSWSFCLFIHVQRCPWKGMLHFSLESVFCEQVVVHNFYDLNVFFT